MEKLTFNYNDVLFSFMVLMALLVCLGFGYFGGRYEQIEINRSLLRAIPEVNCGIH